MGHDSMRAALIYQHATAEAGQFIADALDAQMMTVRALLEDPRRLTNPDSGDTARAEE
ncbi:hypothetical protein [Actinopolymorpha rutila]|uniref:Uncharacterized protein n=2 Tax=Actinopolymorpha rutila TaxID=446787 RepID=A0A852ZHZ4_9ACTN|nr:hypothetical protein [Actinopolymorpha rutila]NYH89229.1 hypothetical protein [Actinopolymorpha rutila]